MGKNSERLYDLIKVDLETVKIIFNEYDASINVVDIQKILTGMSTSNYVVFVDDGKKKFLLKIYPENNDHSDIEIAAYSYANKLIHVPKVCNFDKSRTLFNRTYVILEYIDGLTLGEYLLRNNGFPNEVAHTIGSQLALLHNRRYESMALLNDKLIVAKTLIPFESQYEFYFNGLTGNHISCIIKDRLRSFIVEYRELINKLSEEYVLSHGDFIFSNILVDNTGTPWFIDFEYCFVASRYYDIGKFFRTREKYESYVDDDVYKSFMEGYNSKTNRNLPNDWIVLSKLADIVSMLALINRETIPEGWAGSIEEEINKNLDLLQGYSKSI